MRFLRRLSLFLISELLVVNLVALALAGTAAVTILNQNFIEQELAQLNLYAEFKEEISGKLGEKIPRVELGDFNELLNKAMTRDWMEEQVHDLLDSLFSYLQGKSKDVDFAISTVELKENIKAELRKSLAESPPPELKNMPPQEVERVLAECDARVDGELPDEMDILGKDSEKLGTLKRLREGIHLFYLIFYSLIGLAIALMSIGGLILRNLKGISRFLGESFLVSGLIVLAVRIFGNIFLANRLKVAELPPFAQENVLVRVFADVTMPMQTCSIIFLVVGAVLIFFSFIRWSNKRRVKIPGSPG